MSKNDSISEKQNTVEIADFRQDVIECVTDFAVNVLGVDTPTKLTDNQFCSALAYAHDRYITYNFFNNEHNSSREYADTDKIEQVLDIYILLCNMYDKYISLMGFSSFSGIDDNTIYSWDDKRASSKHRELFKKIKSWSEESLVNNLATGRKNPVGQMGILNNRFGWATSNNRQETVHKIDGLDDIRLALGVND